MSFKYLVCFFILSFNFGYSQTIFQKDSLTILADSLHLEGLYKEAFSLRKQAISNEKNASKEYQAYLKAKYYHTNSAYFEFESYNYHNPQAAITKITRKQYLDSALQSAIKARDLYIAVKNADKKFQYDIQNRIYHQTAYLGNWRHALEQAQLGLRILKDTLSANNKTFVDLIYDIGYIYSKLGDYSKAIENYQASLDLYKNVIGENHTDVALAYNNIAVEYRNLGLHKKELESLLKAKNIWEKLRKDDDKRFLYRCYGNLFYWYSYYGDYDKAEEFILKKQKLRSDKFSTQANGFLRNKEEIHEDKLREWYDLMLHYSRKEDTIKAEFYAQNIINSIHSDKKLLNFEVSILTASLKFYANLVGEKDKDKALSLLDKAISLQHMYKTDYYTKELPFLLTKIELLLKYDSNAEAEQLLKQLDVLNEKKEILEAFKFSILKGKTNQALKKNKLAQNNFDEAFQLLIDDNSGLEKTTLNNLKPLISFEVINGFLDMGDFYMQLFKEEKQKDNLKKATHRYFLASQVYNQLYLGSRYNVQLYKSYNAINSRLLKIAEETNNQEILNDVLNAIENNGSKLTWSKFVFNNQRQQFDISKDLIDKEEAVKAQLSFYQKALLNPEANSEDKMVLWKEKVFELKNELLKIQDSIKQENKAYYEFNIRNFKITNLQANLGEDELVLKYILTDNDVYLFLISNHAIKLKFIDNKALVLNALKTSLSKLKNREHNYQKSFTELKSLLLRGVDLKKAKKLTIVPDGALQYFPFEALILTENMPFVSYASSLLLYNEQKTINPKLESVRLGAFSVSNANSKLVKASDEVKNISAIFRGTMFLNASKSEFLQNANRFDVLHLAMHSHINETYPEFSSLNFCGDEDNQLFISELYNETFKANMAVLSACDTGNGFYENGEGVISLSRAFNYAGIPSTVMSLWKVDDEATSQIMEYFYIHLKKGETKDEALKNAKLDYLKNTNDALLKHPYYWSGFVVTGNTEALVKTHNYWWFLMFLPMLPLVFYRKKLLELFKK